LPLGLIFHRGNAYGACPGREISGGNIREELFVRNFPGHFFAEMFDWNVQGATVRGGFPDPVQDYKSLCPAVMI